MLQWYYLALIASVFMGAATIIEKQTLKAEHALAYSASFSILAALLALAFVPFTSFNISLLQLALIVIAGAMSATMYWLVARVYRHGSVATTSSIYTALPLLFIVILAFLFLGEKLTTVQYLFIAILFAAMYMIMFRGKKQFESGRYVKWLALASLLNAAYTVLLKYILLSVSPYTYLVLSSASIAVFMIVAMHLTYSAREIFRNMNAYKAAIVSVAAFTIAYRVAYYLAASSAAISLVWPVVNAPYILIIVFSSSVLFKEGSVLRKAVLAAIILIAVYFVIY